MSSLHYIFAFFLKIRFDLKPNIIQISDYAAVAYATEVNCYTDGKMHSKTEG